MLARCARCQGTFTTDRFGVQTCPHCGSELLLSDPNAPQGGGTQPPAPPPGSAPPPPSSAGGLPPPAPPPGGPGGPPPAGWPPYGGYGAPPPGPAPEIPSPFSERKTRGFFGAFFETWKRVATRPHEFFRTVRPEAGTAVLFGIIASTAGNAVSALYSYLSGQQMLLAMQQAAERMPEDQARVLRMWVGLVSGKLIFAYILLAPIVTLVVMYVAAGVVHLLLRLFRGANRPFDATLAAVAYANGLNLLLAVPFCGSLIAPIWSLVVLVIGLGEIQRCGSGKAAAAVFAPAVLVCVCCCGAFGLTIPAALKGLEEATKHGQTTTL